MSALGQKQTFCCANAMSALPPKAGIAAGQIDVRFVPIADILDCRCRRQLSLTLAM
jgi:hypothetical protein